MRFLSAAWTTAGAVSVLLMGLDGRSAVAADKPAIGPHDIATLFFINKSDDKNRVDYGIRLDADCVPWEKNAVFPYWRVFEPTPAARTVELNMLDRVAYGIKSQHLISRTATSSEYYLLLKAIHRELFITITKADDGHCRSVVYIAMAGQERAELLSAYVKLRRPLAVEYLEIHGKDHRTGQPISERVTQ